MLATKSQTVTVPMAQVNEWKSVMERLNATVNAQRLKLGEQNTKIAQQDGEIEGLRLMANPSTPEAIEEDEDSEQKIAEVESKSFGDVVGQTEIISRLKVVVNGSKLRGVPMCHTLIEGPSGHGKSTLARIISDEMGVKLIQTSAPLLKNPAKISELLVSIREPTTLFLDEIHSLSVPVAEILYEAMADGRISILTEGGSTTINLPPLNVVGATTAGGRLPVPFKNRFPLQLYMDRYTLIEIAEIVSRAWDKEGVRHTKDAAIAVAQRSRLVPRTALALGELVANHAAVESVVDGETTLTEAIAMSGLERFGVQEDGLSEVDMMVLKVLVEAGRYVGLDELASRCDIDKTSIQASVEPPLLRDGFLSRGPKGRIALEKAYDLFGVGLED